MSEANKNIENLFKEKLDNHESIVRADLWNSISGALPAATPTAAGIALKTKILIGVAATVASIATIYFVNQNNGSPQHSSPQQTEQTIAPKNSETIRDTSTVVAEVQNKGTETPNQAKAADESDVVLSSNTQLIVLNDQELEDFQNFLSDYSKTATNHTFNQSSAVQPNADSSPKDSDNADSKNESEPLVMQIKEVNNKDLLYFFFSPQKAELYEWWINGKLISNNSTLNYNFEEDGVQQIRLVTTSDDGTKNEISQTVEAYRNIIFNLPNAFSPNGDGMNDNFDVQAGVEHVQHIDRLIISDKQGKTIYESTTKFVWDGNSMDGNICPSGVYTYTIFATDKKSKPQLKGGTIQLFIE